MLTELIKDTMDSETAVGAGTSSHITERDTIEAEHSKKMTCKLETTDQSTFSDQCHRMNGNG